VRAHDGWKLVGVKGQVELFNLNDDVGESKNLIDKHPERAAQLRKAYDGWLDQMATPVSGYKRWTPEVEAAAKNKKANKAKKKKGAKQ
jgi:hypothetical protein